MVQPKQAWNISDKKEVWTHEFQHQNWGPILSTAGGLLFAGGTNDRMFRAFDAKSGEVLWDYPTNSGVTAPPSTFTVNGK
ncbi:MAG TPA: PQQ-dependent dehydrogenase, methanol/ethanol family, partial [Alphaproteobacteria bacterium]|nr:PQQ-dependent dehydrogenase, methanol/ethanol family [Alphaproteobacteria bacterium]